MKQRRQTIQVICFISESVALIIPMLPTSSQKLILQQAFETAAQINEELKRMEFDGAFCKKFRFLIDRFFFHFFTKCRKSVEKMTHKKKNRGHRTSKIAKSRQSYSNGHLPYHCSFHYLVRARCMTWRVNFRAQ